MVVASDVGVLVLGAAAATVAIDTVGVFVVVSSIVVDVVAVAARNVVVVAVDNIVVVRGPGIVGVVCPY